MILLTPFNDKNNKLGKEGNFIKLIKGIYRKFPANIIINNKRLNTLHPK